MIEVKNLTKSYIFEGKKNYVFKNLNFFLLFLGALCLKEIELISTLLGGPQEMTPLKI